MVAQVVVASQEGAIAAAEAVEAAIWVAVVVEGTEVGARVVGQRVVVGLAEEATVEAVQAAGAMAA